MIIQLFVFAAFFIGFGIFLFFKKKSFLAWMFILAGIVSFVLGYFVVSLYPQTLPF